MSFTPNLAFDLQSHLGNAGTWDTPLNSNFTALDAILGGTYTKSVTGIGAAATFTSANCYANIIRFSGTLAQTLTVTFTTTVAKVWTFEKTTLDAAGTNIIVTNGIGNTIALPPGSCQAYWDGSNFSFTNMGQLAQYSDLATTVVPSWIGSCTVPPYLLCDGSTFSAVTYPLLNAHLGGNTLPDYRGRGRFYADGGTGRITAANSGVNGTTFGAAGGAANVTVAQANLPSVTLHMDLNSLKVNGNNAQASDGTQVTVAAGATPVPAGSTSMNTMTGGNVPLGGSGQAATTLPPVAIGGITLLRAM